VHQLKLGCFLSDTYQLIYHTSLHQETLRVYTLVIMNMSWERHVRIICCESKCYWSLSLITKFHILLRPENIKSLSLETIKVSS
jgi:hypothetical protein